MALGSGANLDDAFEAGWSSAKSGFVIGVIAGGSSAAAKAMSSKIDPFTGERIEMHHSDPKFMGGDPNQELTPLKQSLHRELHQDLNDYLKMQTDDFGNHMRPQRGNPGIRIQETFTRPIRIEAMNNFYDINRFSYPRSRYDFYKNNGIR